MLAAIAVGTVVAACGGDGGDGDSSTPTATSAAGTAATPTPAEQVGTPTSSTNVAPAGLRGFIYPIEGACLPENDDLMPGADRDYRNGTHEGVDFYDSDNCVSMGVGTEIVAAKAGTVIRADLDYEELTQEDVDRLLELVEEGEAGDPVIQDRFRGRQVWIDHGSRIETRYAHLSDIPDDIFVGKQVAQGEVIGYMGDSGAPEAVEAPGTQVHLHFELRVWGGYVGQGRPVDEVRSLYEAAFAP